MSAMKTIVIFIVVMLVLTSCAAQRSLKFTTYRTNYIMNLPGGYELRKVKDDGGFKEYQAIYPDGSIIYITDDNQSGGSINKAKEEKYGTNVYTRILASDSLNLMGEHNEGRFWKEEKLDKVVIGYINVPAEKKELYDRSLSSIRVRK